MSKRTKLPRYSKPLEPSWKDWRFYVCFDISVVVHLLLLLLIINQEDKVSAIQSNKVQKGIEVTLSAAPKPAQAQTPAKPKTSTPKPKPVAKPRPPIIASSKPEKPPTIKPVPKPTKPKRPETPVIKPEPLKPRKKPVKTERPVSDENESLPEFNDEFSELSKDYSRTEPTTSGNEPFGGNPALSDNGVNPGSIVNINPRINYPLQAMRQNIRGIVEVLIHIAPDGTVSDVDLVRSSGYDILDNEVLGAVQHWRFSPPKRGGVPIESTYKHSVIFGTDEVIYDDFENHWREIKLMPSGG